MGFDTGRQLGTKQVNQTFTRSLSGASNFAYGDVVPSTSKRPIPATDQPEAYARASNVGCLLRFVVST